MKKILITLLVLLTPSLVQAYSVEISVDSGRESINALEAVIHIPQGINVSQIETGRSAILIWIQEPKFDKETKTIVFSGISPGGFHGKQALFSLSGDLKESDLTRVTYTEIKAFSNDGKGNPVSVSMAAHLVALEEDVAPPEPFIPIIAHSPELFEGRPFLSFLTQDKGLGIDRYEYSSTWLLAPSDTAWQPVISPLALSKLDLFKIIHIRAIDKSGNQRMVSISGNYHYASILFGIIIILCVLFLVQRSFF